MINTKLPLFRVALVGPTPLPGQSGQLGRLGQLGQSLNRLDRLEDMKDDSAEILLPVFFAGGHR